VLACAAIVAGCDISGQGGPSTEADAKAEVVMAVHAFQDATLNHDAASYCQALTLEARASTVSALYAPGGRVHCRRAVGQLLELASPHEFDTVRQARRAVGPAAVRVLGGRASVTLPGGRSVGLVRVGGVWLIYRPPAP
jgi:hypothetical protein